LPSLKFRTAGFPQYGFKAGWSDKAFPCDAALASISLPSPFAGEMGTAEGTAIYFDS